MAQRRLKIGYVIDTYDGLKGGGVISARRFVEALGERHDITLITTGEPAPGRVILPGYYIPFAKNLMKKMGFIFAWPDRRALEAAFRDLDIIHVQLPFYLGVRSVAIAKEMGIPVVTAFHVQPENILLNIRIRSATLSRWIYKLFISTFYGRSDGVHCPSEFARNELRRHGVEVPCRVISNGLTNKFSSPAQPRGPHGGGDFTLLSVGRLAREKRLHLVIEAVKLSKHAGRIQWIATGAGPLRDKIEKLGAALPKPAQVLFVSDAELIDLYHSADLFVQASEVELEGMAVLEALGCGLPALISNNATSASTQFAASPDFLFENDNVRELAAKIDHLIENPKLIADARAWCAERAKEFRMADMIGEIEDFYHDVIDRAPAMRTASPTAAEEPASSAGRA